MGRNCSKLQIDLLCFGVHRGVGCRFVRRSDGGSDVFCDCVRVVAVAIRSRSVGDSCCINQRDSGCGRCSTVVVVVFCRGSVGGRCVGWIVVVRIGGGRNGGCSGVVRDGARSRASGGSDGARRSRSVADRGRRRQRRFRGRLVRRVHVQRYVQLKRPGAVGFLHGRLGRRGGHGHRLVRARETAATTTVHRVELLEKKVPLGLLVELDHLDAPAHGVGPVTVRTLVERRRDEYRLGRDPPTGTGAAEATGTAGRQQLVPRRRHQLFLDDDPAADEIVLALLEVRRRPAGQEQQQQGAQTQRRSGHAS